jgi:hypothetical protein
MSETQKFANATATAERSTDIRGGQQKISLISLKNTSRQVNPATHGQKFPVFTLSETEKLFRITRERITRMRHLYCHNLNLNQKLEDLQEEILTKIKQKNPDFRYLGLVRVIEKQVQDEYTDFLVQVNNDIIQEEVIRYGFVSSDEMAVNLGYNGIAHFLSLIPLYVFHSPLDRRRIIKERINREIKNLENIHKLKNLDINTFLEKVRQMNNPDLISIIQKLGEKDKLSLLKNEHTTALLKILPRMEKSHKVIQIGGSSSLKVKLNRNTLIESRQYMLGWDYNRQKFVQHEMRAAIKLEETYKELNLTRHNGSGDWLDLKTGIIFDESISSIPQNLFCDEWQKGEIQNSLLEHTNGIKSDFCVIDTSNLKPRHIKMLQKFIRNNPHINDSKVIFLK